ncbi:unnamed protein product [Parnassius apollo]|uniref:(apollo) hypothetical protein n=1 Tax=Parnassius apollo TaxID=110799 RepID=A0A8S3Y4M2_PARAO|nr:unnamed protein product [Parnassius apollo]
MNRNNLVFDSDAIMDQLADSDLGENFDNDNDWHPSGELPSFSSDDEDEQEARVSTVASPSLSNKWTRRQFIGKPMPTLISESTFLSVPLISFKFTYFKYVTHYVFTENHIDTETSKTKEYTEMSCEQIDNVILDLLARNKDKQITELIKTCSDYRKLVSENTLKKLFRSYSITGKTDKVILLQKYCSVVDPNLYKLNGEFMHYLAKAHCYKGNSEKGLSILSHCYKKYDGLRGFYRIIFRELIQDSVLNRSEATLVIFKKYVLEFSNKFDDNYPLICFWYICWSSTWFSDQMLANELLESSEKLQNIVRDKATTFSINILREYNDDAVLRLLQSLLKYKMMSDYVKVLQVLFGYKLRNRDLRGCREIILNCEALGLSLPADQQGQYIRLLIDNKLPNEKPTPSKIVSKDFKLRF